MTKTRLRCHGCGYDMDVADCLWDPEAQVAKGDLTMCLNCGLLYQSEGEDKWRRLKRKERRGLDKDILAQLTRMEEGRAKIITRDLALEQMLRDLKP